MPVKIWTIYLNLEDNLYISSINPINANGNKIKGKKTLFTQHINIRTITNDNPPPEIVGTECELLLLGTSKSFFK